MCDPGRIPLPVLLIAQLAIAATSPSPNKGFRLKEVLDSPQHKIARMAGVTPLTLPHNRDQILEELTPRTRKRPVTLYQVVRHLGPLRSDALVAILQRHVFEDEEGRRDSVVSALQQEKYSLETLLLIAETAQAEYGNQWNSTSPDVSDAIAVSA